MCSSSGSAPLEAQEVKLTPNSAIFSKKKSRRNYREEYTGINMGASGAEFREMVEKLGSAFRHLTVFFSQTTWPIRIKFGMRHRGN